MTAAPAAPVATKPPPRDWVPPVRDRRALPHRLTRGLICRDVQGVAMVDASIGNLHRFATDLDPYRFAQDDRWPDPAALQDRAVLF